MHLVRWTTENGKALVGSFTDAWTFPLAFMEGLKETEKKIGLYKYFERKAKASFVWSMYGKYV